MTTMMIENVSEYANKGKAFEQSLRYALGGTMESGNSLAFDKGSDYEPLHLSIKSESFTLASANVMRSKTFEGQVNEFFERTASKRFAYVANSLKVYNMTAREFRQFVNQFCSFSQESKKNGGGYKVRMRSESKAVIEWLEKTSKRYEKGIDK